MIVQDSRRERLTDLSVIESEIFIRHREKFVIEASRGKESTREVYVKISLSLFPIVFLVCYNPSRFSMDFGNN